MAGENPIANKFISFSKIMLGIAVAAAAIKQVFDVALNAKEQKLIFDWLWIAIGCALYGAGIFFVGEFWRIVAEDIGGRPRRFEASRAFIVSQLAKYIPGKAWVLFVRCALTDNSRVPAEVAITASFYESAAGMGCASMLALCAMCMSNDVVDPRLTLLSLAMTAFFFALTTPKLFSRAALFAASKFKKGNSDVLKPVKTKTLKRGFLPLLFGWLLVGFSAAASGVGIGADTLSGVGLLAAIGGSLLAIAGGFAVFVSPAGLGVREWIMMVALAPIIGQGCAGMFAISARLTTIVSEIILGGILYIVGLHKRSPNKYCDTSLQ